MKQALSLSFLLLACALATVSADEPVKIPILDTKGVPLKFGVPYYVLPSIDAWGGGVTLPHGTENMPCPKGIVVSKNETVKGTPVVFYSANRNASSSGNITMGTEVLISFYNASEHCGLENATAWVTKSWHLTVGNETDATVFLIRQSGLAYTYLLMPVSPYKKEQFVVIREVATGELLVDFLEKADISFVFEEVKSKNETKFDQVIKMPRKIYAA